MARSCVYLVYVCKVRGVRSRNQISDIIILNYDLPHCASLSCNYNRAKKALNYERTNSHMRTHAYKLVTLAAHKQKTKTQRGTEKKSTHARARARWLAAHRQ